MILDHYDWAGGREAMLRFGPESGPVAVIAMPLFEEANRMRALVVALCRALAAHGVASVLPDLPGTGDSLTLTEEARLTDWQYAFSSAANHAAASDVFAVGMRGGALLDARATLAGRWHFAPTPGSALVRDLRRTRLGETSEVADAPVALAGNLMHPALLDELETALPASDARTVRLETDPQPAHRKIAATPLWRRAEPDNDPALAALLADDIAEWIARCGA